MRNENGRKNKHRHLHKHHSTNQSDSPLHVEEVNTSVQIVVWASNDGKCPHSPFIHAINH